MRAWLLRLLTPPAPPHKALVALEDRVEALEGRREKDRAEFKALRGFVYALKRGEPAAQEPASDPTPDGRGVEEHPPRAVSLSGHLARRFRIGG